MTRTRVLVTIGAWLLAWVALWLSDADPSAVALAGIVIVIVTVVVVAVDLGRTAQSVRWPLPPHAGQSSERPKPVPRTLRGVEAKVGSDPVELHRVLVEVIDERIRWGHDIDRRRAPDDADHLLTSALRTYVDGAPRRRLDDRELWRILNDIEAL